MTIKFTCKNCGRQRELDDDLRGKKVRCKCGETTRLGEKPTTVERAEEIFSSDIFASGLAESRKRSEEEPIPQAPVYDAGFEIEPVEFPNPPSDLGPTSSQPLKVEAIPSFTNHSIVRLMLAMVAGTLAILFAFLVFTSLYDMLLPALAEQRQLREEFGDDFAQSFPRFLGVKIFAIMGILIAVLYGLVGIGQIAAAWMQFIRKTTHYVWVDILVASISLVWVVSLVAVFIYASYQIYEIKNARLDEIRLNQKTFSTTPSPQVESQFDAQIKTANESYRRTRWILFREIFVHCLIPSLVMGISLFRVLRQ